MKRRLACSDIHGEGNRLLQVLAKAHYAPGSDRLFLLGDYIDRGTDSKRTVEIVRGLQHIGAKVLRGNHDPFAMEIYNQNPYVDYWIHSQGGDATLRDFGGFPPLDVAKWLNALPIYHEEPDCILVHAGLKPNVPLIDQNPQDLIWIRGEFHRNYRGKRVIFGHTPTPLLHGDDSNFGIWHGPDKTGIDTWAAYSGPLTLLDIDSGQTWTA